MLCHILFHSVGPYEIKIEFILEFTKRHGKQYSVFIAWENAKNINQQKEIGVIITIFKDFLFIY